ncbi:Tim10/DDP family zinc finger protein, partial [Fimicolochytrium jonesii]|uniref:Tim10/DDP family zinc finger protein n=1 Tax=Fimicolochytrium jonesii TaxID=1396493 RepID=UPI0022FE4509
GEKTQEIMDQIRREVAMQNFQELLSQINKKCFAKCVPKPGAKLDSSEQTCLQRCSDRYQEAWNVVSNAYLRRAQKE